MTACCGAPTLRRLPSESFWIHRWAPAETSLRMFESLTERLQSALSKLTRKGELTEADVDEALRLVRTALLTADVHVRVVKKLVADIRERAVGEKVLESVSRLTALAGPGRSATRAAVASMLPSSSLTPLMSGIRIWISAPLAARACRFFRIRLFPAPVHSLCFSESISFRS